MSIRVPLDPRPSNPMLRRPHHRRATASRPRLESLEDRCLLSLGPAVSYPVGVNPQAVITGDFNGDGRPDLAVANASGNSVSLLLGNAGGTFQAAQNIATGANPQSLAVGDFNKDGKLDLTTANSNDVSVLLGNGNGTFLPPANTGLSGCTSVAVGDFNGDGKLDLGVTSSDYVPGSWGGYGFYPGYYLGHVNVLIGNGAGSFSTPNTIHLGEGFQTSAVVADFNGDGRQDLAAESSDRASVTVMLGTATGLGAPNVFAAGVSRAMTVGDVNGDGKADLVTAMQYVDTISVMLGTGLGTFEAAKYYYVGTVANSVAMADFNGDGKLDLVTANQGVGSVGVLLGTGTGTFRPPVITATGAGTVGVAVGDFNGDGRPDASTAVPNSGKVAVLVNDGIWSAPGAPSISVGDVMVTEGNTGTSAATFIVRLSAAYGTAVSVHYATRDGSAMAGSDYQATSGTITFAPGQTSKTITVLVNGDRVGEYGEDFLLLLTNPTNAFLADDSATGTILNDEPDVSIIEFVTDIEGNTGTRPFIFTVMLSVAYDVPVTVGYATADLTPDEYGRSPATAGVDYAAKFGTVTFAAGQTTQTITVLVIGDRVGEDNEQFSVNLTSTTAGLISVAQGIGVIINDEPPVVMIGGTTVVEGNSGTRSMIFTVALIGSSDAPVTVNYATADGTATLAGGDYRATSGTLTFAPGQTSKTIAVLINGDRLVESSYESLGINLTGATNALITGATGYGIIQDDEPLISIGDVSKAEGKNGQSTLFTFTVTLSAAYDQAVTMSFRTVNGTATTGDNDYIARTGTLTFNPGETSKTITIEVKGDSKRESNETFYLDLFGNSANSLLIKNRGIGTIRNDD